MILSALASDSKAIDTSAFAFLNKDVIVIIIGGSAALFISDIVKRKPKTKAIKILDSIGTKLAVFSYSLYLTHWQVLRVINHYFGRSKVLDEYAILKLVLTIIVCLLFAYLFYWITERNTSAVKKWLGVSKAQS